MQEDTSQFKMYNITKLFATMHGVCPKQDTQSPVAAGKWTGNIASWSIACTYPDTIIIWTSKPWLAIVIAAYAWFNFVRQRKDCDK